MMQSLSFLICGEGVTGREELLKETFGERALVIGGGHSGRLWALAGLGWLKLEAGQTEDLAAFQPFYLRRPTIGQRSCNPTYSQQLDKFKIQEDRLGG